MIPFPEGFVYGGVDGVLGLFTDGVICDTQVIGSNHLDSLTWVGDTLIAATNRPNASELTFYLIDFSHD